MSYGSNLAAGLQPYRTITGAPWNNQTNTYLIASGYANNIGRGDLVAVLATGYIVNLIDFNANQTAFTTSASVGVFMGCSYQTTASTNPIDPASPARMYWPSAQTTLNSVPAVAFVVDDPSVTFNIQGDGVGGAAITQAAVGATAAVAYTTTGSIGSGAQVTVNTNTGASLMSLSQASIGTGATQNLRILRLIPSPPNTSTVYNNVEVLIQNHSYASRPAGI